jgi:hypothetical protein
VTNSHLLHELAGLFRDYESESGEILIHASLQFVSKVDPCVGDVPITSEIYAWNGNSMIILPPELATVDTAIGGSDVQ